jgi:uncharacterized protein (DUF427 family)
MDGWFEEDEEAYTHPATPTPRVDILATSRQVRVVVAGLVAFHNEEVDLVIDDQLQERPITKFSRGSRTTRSE